MASPEALLIIGKMKGKKGAEPKGEDASDEGEGASEDTGAEARRAAAEDVFKAATGREPSESEAKAMDEALYAYWEAC